MTQEQTTHAAIVQEYRLWMNRTLRAAEREEKQEGTVPLMPSFWDLCWRKRLLMILDLSNRQRINGILIAYDEQAVLLESRGRLHLIPLRSITRVSLAETDEKSEEWREQAPLQAAQRSIDSFSAFPWGRERGLPIAPMYWDC